MFVLSDQVFDSLLPVLSPDFVDADLGNSGLAATDSSLAGELAELNCPSGSLIGECVDDLVGVDHARRLQCRLHFTGLPMASPLHRWNKRQLQKLFLCFLSRHATSDNG